jgi:hypothetical protein
MSTQPGPELEEYPHKLFERKIDGDRVEYIGSYKDWEEAAKFHLPIDSKSKQKDTRLLDKMRYTIREENGDLVDIQERGFNIQYVQVPVYGMQSPGIFGRRKAKILWYETLSFVVQTDKKGEQPGEK